MILERLAAWLALHCPENYVTIKPTFKMLFETKIIKDIDFEVRVGFRDRFLKFIQHIEALTQRATVYVKASDIGQIIGYTVAKLSGIKPAVTSVIPFKGLETI